MSTLSWNCPTHLYVPAQSMCSVCAATLEGSVTCIDYKGVTIDSGDIAGKTSLPSNTPRTFQDELLAEIRGLRADIRTAITLKTELPGIAQDLLQTLERTRAERKKLIAFVRLVGLRPTTIQEAQALLNEIGA